LKSESKAPGHTDQIFGFKPGRGWSTIIHRATLVLVIYISPCAPTRRIAIADVEPKYSVFRENASNLLEKFDQVLEIVFDVHFGTNLASNPIVAKSPVGRGSDHALKTSIWKSGKDTASVADYDLAEILGVS
jgi:hypothetical protein